MVVPKSMSVHDAGSRISTGEAKEAPPRRPSLPPRPAAVSSNDAAAHQDGAPAEADEPDEGDSERSSFSLAAVPGWLVSLLVHLLVLVALGLLTFRVSEDKQRELTLVAIDETEEELVEYTVEIQQLENLEQHERQAISAPEDPGAIDFGEIASDIQVETSSDVGAVAMPDPSVEIGALFGSEGQGFSKAGTGAGGAEFFGVKSSGNRFVFVVDGSSSMGRARKWDECRKELMKAVGKLSPKQHFYVFLFSRKSHRMFGNGDKQVDRLVRATPENIEKLRHWLYYDYKLGGGTVPIAGLREALEEMQPDAIYLLSDGQFTDKGNSEKYLLQFAKTRNDRVMFETGDRYRIFVHTIAFHSRRGEVVLKGIADAFKATFRFVPAGK